MTRRTALAASALALLLPSTAGASTIEVSASAGPSASEYIEYRATKGEANRVRVLFAKGSVVIVDKSTKRITPKRDAGFGRCRATSRQRVVCPAMPLFAILRDGNDRFSAAPGDHGAAPTSTDPRSYAASYEDTEGAVTETLLVDAGSGDDFVSGSKFTDTLFPGPGTDTVQGRAGPDAIYSVPDGAADSLDGGGSIDSILFLSSAGVTVDLAAGTGGPAGELDRLAQFERVHGGPGGDDIRGTDGSEALYGESGRDRVDGRGGNDMVAGDAPDVLDGSPNDLFGGDGDDVLDTRAEKPSPTSTVACGAGNDSHVGGDDALLDPSCESALLRVGFGSLPRPADEDVLYELPMKATPVAKTPDSVTFEVPCPNRRNGACTGKLEVQDYGSANFSFSPAERRNVTVPLSPAGQAAVAGSSPVAVRLSMDLNPVNQGQFTSRAFLGWQADL